jgi:hypothetical protein
MRLPMTDFRVDVVDGMSEPPRVRFEIPTTTKLLGSAQALARALYQRRRAEGHPGDLVRVQLDGETVYTYSLLNCRAAHAEERATGMIVAERVAA